MVVQVKPFRKLRQVHNQGKRTRVRDLIRYDMRQMHAAFTGTLPVGSTAESLGHTQVHTHHTLSLRVHAAHTPHDVGFKTVQEHSVNLLVCLGAPATHPTP